MSWVASACVDFGEAEAGAGEFVGDDVIAGETCDLIDGEGDGLAAERLGRNAANERSAANVR
jgi:hypothetical protein